MIYREYTEISEIVDLISRDWTEFKQDLQERKIVGWLETHHGQTIDELEKQLHKDWVTLYPYIATLRVFNAFKCINKEVSDEFIRHFKTKYKNEIENEINEFRLLEKFVDTLQVQKSLGGRPIVGFLLTISYEHEYGVYFLYEGKNYFGSGSNEEDNFQRIVTGERLLELKHFCIEVSRNQGFRFSVCNNAEGFVKGSEKEFREGPIDYRDSLELGSLKITIINNYN